MKAGAAMPDQGKGPTDFRSAFLLAYGLGTLLCVVGPLLMLVLLGHGNPSKIPGLAGLAEELGYTFTGLVVLSALFVVRRSKKVSASFATLAEHRRARVMVIEILLYSAIFGLSALFGLIYLGLGGPRAEGYSRSFIGLATVMFLLFVPRLGSWRKAAAGDHGPGVPHPEN
jgi:hypothetical protein